MTGRKPSATTADARAHAALSDVNKALCQSGARQLKAASPHLLEAHFEPVINCPRALEAFASSSRDLLVHPRDLHSRRGSLEQESLCCCTHQLGSCRAACKAELRILPPPTALARSLPSDCYAPAALTKFPAHFRQGIAPCAAGLGMSIFHPGDPHRRNFRCRVADNQRAARRETRGVQRKGSGLRPVRDTGEICP